MRVSPSGIKQEKINLDDFPDDFPQGTKNCFDCKHFVVSLGKFQKCDRKEKAIARCKKNLLLVEDCANENGTIRDGVYQFYAARLIAINLHGWRHQDWNFANRCEEFEDMRDQASV